MNKISIAMMTLRIGSTMSQSNRSVRMAEMTTAIDPNRSAMMCQKTPSTLMLLLGGAVE